MSNDRVGLRLRMDLVDQRRVVVFHRIGPAAESRDRGRNRAVRFVTGHDLGDGRPRGDGPLLTRIWRIGFQVLRSKAVQSPILPGAIFMNSITMNFG